MTVGEIAVFLVTTLSAGVAGGLALELVMMLFSNLGWARGSMVIALGSLITRSRTNARRVGVIAHVASAVVFSIAYSLLMLGLGIHDVAPAVSLGLGVGFVHGMLVSLMLVWVVSDQHPLEEYRGADLLIGLSHLVGHMAFGAVVGLVFGLSPI
jgi:hypothetical protein